MKIVINISENIYTRLFDNGIETSLEDREAINIAIRGGTPLPKGHGRLIDADALNLDYEVEMADDWKTAHEIANCVKYAPTIIEADKAESEDKE